MKKLLTLILSVTLLLGCIYVPASAEEPLEPLNDHFEDELIVDNTSETTDEDYYRYILPLYSSDVVYSQFYNNISYSIDIGSETSYNNLKVSYASTTDITLTNYADRTLLYSDTISVPITFNIEYAPYEDEILTDFHAAEFSEVLLSFAAYKDGEIKETKTISLYVFPTDVGVFISSLGKEEAFNAYVEFLKLKNVIDEATYKSAIQSATTTGYSCTESEFEEEKLQDYIEEYCGLNRVLKYYNEDANAISEKSKHSIQIEKQTSSYTSGAEITAETNAFSLHIPTIQISRSIEIVNSSTNKIKISGEVMWNDISSNTWHPMREVQVNVMDDEVVLDKTLATVYTNNNGYYSAIITNDLGVFEGGYDIYIKVTPMNDNFNIVGHGATELLDVSYSVSTDKNQNVQGAIEKVYYYDAGKNSIKALQIHQALVAGYSYYKAFNSNDVNYTKVYYPRNDENEVSSSDHSDNKIEMYKDDYFDWDAVTHELGHQAHGHIGASSPFGGSHNMSENMLLRYDKEKALGMAWNEGWATYFAIVSQEYYNTNHATITTIYTAADKDYCRTKIVSETTLEDEHVGFCEDSTNAIPSYGDCHEYAVASLLLNLLWDEEIELQESDIWLMTKNAGPYSITSFVTQLYNSLTEYNIPLIGKWLEINNIVDAPQPGQSRIITEDEELYLFWNAANTNTTIPYNFQVLFWDENLNIVYESPMLSRYEISSMLRMDYSVWVKVLYDLGDDEVCYWSLASSNPLDTSTSAYYSSLVKLVIDDRIQNMSSFNTAYTDTLVAGEEEWFKFTAPSTGSYTFFSQNTLDVKAELFDSENLDDDDVIKQDDDSGENYNFSITHNINMGDTVYLKVSGYSRYAAGPISIYVKTP